MRAFFETKLLHRPAIALALSLGALSCGAEFEPRTTLSGHRVIGIEANPPETTPEGVVELSVHDFYDGEEALRYSWSVCPHGLGADHDYACAVPELELPLGSAPTVTLDLGPDGIDLPGLFDAMGPTFAADGSPRTLTNGIDLWVTLVSGPDCSDCKSITTVKRVVVREGDYTPNHNPTIEQLEVVGTPTPGATLSLRVSVGEPETYLDALTGAERTETYLYTWYTTGGETNPGSTSGSDRETELLLPTETGPVQVTVVVRDGRGGFALEQRQIGVE